MVGLRRLDLHGLRHEEARRAVVRFTEDNWNSNTEAEIITGNSKQMIEIVTSVLREYRLSFKIGGALSETGFVTTWFE